MDGGEFICRYISSMDARLYTALSANGQGYIIFPPPLDSQTIFLSNFPLQKRRLPPYIGSCQLTARFFAEQFR
jgi:hypothetical protein